MKKEGLLKNLNEKINSGEIKMRSPKYFEFLTVFGIVGTSLLFLFTVFFVNTEFHAVSQHMAFTYLTFKGFGLYEFIMRAPIINFLIGLVFLILLITVFLNFKKFYKLGRLKVLIAFVLLALLFGFLINLAGLNEILEENAYFKHLYLFKGNNREVFVTGWLGKSEDESLELSTKSKIYILDLTALTPTVVQSLKIGDCEKAQGEVEDSSLQVRAINPSNSCNFPREE